MNVRSLRFRVAAWYFASVTAIFALAAVGYWLAVRSALDCALDQGLRYRLAGLRQYLEAESRRRARTSAPASTASSGSASCTRCSTATAGSSPQSYGLERHHVRPASAEQRGARDPLRVGRARQLSAPARLAAGHHRRPGADPGGRRSAAQVRGRARRVHVDSAAVHARSILALATAGGVWLGRHALAPVARITQDARAITEENLSARLAVPDSRDELQQLSETLNGMLDRIERSFTRTRQFTRTPRTSCARR